ncbi:MAG: alginate lyase family protein [Phycisphaerae bacterium]
MQSHLLTGVFIIVFVVSLLVSASAADVPGEFNIPTTLPLDANQLTKLRRLVKEDDEAAALAETIKRACKGLVGGKPRPLEVIHYEGLVNTHPKRIATVRKLKDLADVARLVSYWQVTGDPNAADAMERYVLAWSSTYKITGNDVNENKFFPLLNAYLAVRSRMEKSQRTRVEAWIRRMGEAHRRAVAKPRQFSNRYGKSLRILAQTGMILAEEKWIAEARQGVKRFVKEALRADGRSRDLERRDTLTYHGSSLKTPMDLAIMLGRQGRELYTWENDAGGSIKKSVDYVVPYALGKKKRKEWQNSKVGLDRRRSKAGLEKYKRGRLFRPKDALGLMEKASYFDPSLVDVVVHILDSDAKRFPTWRVLLNEAARPGEPDEAEGRSEEDRPDTKP